MKRDILLAFSGGIDSCAAVGLLQADGYRVEAATIDMIGDEAMLNQARNSAERLGITLHIIDGRKEFEQQVINNFINEYQVGRTPAPCTRCNTMIKWELIVKKADELGIYHIATGHYFQITELNGKRYVTRGVDPVKDQSYYLWGVSQEILSRAVTPMGKQIKAEVKLHSENKSESMGVCFLNKRPYIDFICTKCGELPCGEVVNNNGEVIAEHNGIARYTIGQRRGDGIPAGLRVIALDADQNRVIVGENALLYHKKLTISNCNFVDIQEVIAAPNITVMVRGLGLNPQGYATVNITSQSEDNKITAEVNLSNPAWAAAPGQPVVLYIGDRVVGGGYLEKSE